MSANTTTAKADPKPLNLSQLRNKLADAAGLTAKQVGAVLDALADTAKAELNRDGVGAFAIPGLVKLTKVVKPAVAGGVEKKNPFKPGEMMVTKDRPAKNVLKLRALKPLKDGIA